MMQPTQIVFELVLARPVICEGREHSMLVHLWWRAPSQGQRLVQVYVDGSLADVSSEPSQRELWLMCDRVRPHRIELLAVDANDVNALWSPHTALLQNWTPNVKGEIALAMVRDPSLPVDAQVQVSLDGNAQNRGALWPANESRIGMGAIFGLGEFGRDAITGPGLGSPESQLGLGPLGADGTAWQWQRDGVTAGTHTLGVNVTSGDEQNASQNWSQNETFDALPTSPKQITIDSDFTLHWTA